jgi:hypothetical protein
MNVLDLAEAAVSASSDDPEGTSLTVDKILRLLDTRGSCNEHLANPSNHPRRGCIKPRSEPLTGDEPVYGDFLVLVYGAHDPFVRLDDFPSLEVMERWLASNEGIVNSFITYAIAFIDRKPRPYAVAYSTPDGDVQEFDKWAQNLIGRQPAEEATVRWVVWK